ncbi:hypothetical protein CCYS_03915 [Corynebacterium cystitidis DSM 20524]|nr:hypothetical protein CCYS_03915 [Corynebacterium cystitidis DSM 20524]SNV84176.1 transposase [Corynebacterium cystitidis]
MWLFQQPQDFLDRVKVISMDGFRGYATATNEIIA